MIIKFRFTGDLDIDKGEINVSLGLTMVKLDIAIGLRIRFDRV